MGAPGTAYFEEIRDTLFIDPRNPAKSSQDLALGAQAVIEGVAGRNASVQGEPDTPDYALRTAAEYMNGAYSPAGPISPPARHFDHLSVAQLHPAGLKPAILAGLAGLIANNNTIVAQVSGLETVYEKRSIDWLLENVAGFTPYLGSGQLVTGGTSANLTAMAVARLKLERSDPAFHRQTVVSKLLGWTGLVPRSYTTKQAVLFGTAMDHYSAKKTATLLGPNGTIKFEHVPLEKGGFRMDVAKLEKRVRRARRKGIPIMGIIAVAGETETGAIDDIEGIAVVASRYGAYLHVDAAYGGPFRLVGRLASRFRGMERANSVAIDPHKYMYTPYQAGAALFRDSADHALLQDLNGDGTSYMFQDANSRRAQAWGFTNNPYLGQRRLEGSMGGQTAAMVFQTIRTLGKEGLAALLEHNIEMTKEFANQLLGRTNLVPAFEPELNTLCLRPDVDLRTLTVSERQRFGQRIEDTCKLLEEKYGIYVCPTDLPALDERLRRKGVKEKVFRFVFTHPYTGQNEVKYIADMLVKEWEGTAHA
jgi:glutamate/tyrosine decarboxylase-like PLP-dependent enzyme